MDLGSDYYRAQPEVNSKYRLEHLGRLILLTQEITRNTINASNINNQIRCPWIGKRA
jgi:hypothetical protein